jgi:hypothetical protein
MSELLLIDQQLMRGLVIVTSEPSDAKQKIVEVSSWRRSASHGLSRSISEIGYGGIKVSMDDHGNVT